MRDRIQAALFVASLCAGTGAPALAANVTDADLRQAAVDLGHSYDGNYAAKDPAAMANLYAADGILVSPAGPIVRGRDALFAYYKKRFASGASGHHIEIVEAHVEGNSGFSIARFSVKVPQSSGQVREEQGTLVAIYQHETNGWRFRLVEPSIPPSEKK